MKIRKRGRGKPLHPDTDRLVGACHEAAHAFEAHSLGLEIDRITLDEHEARKADATFAGFTSRECGTAEENARVSLAARVADAMMEDQLGVTFVFPDVERHHDELAAASWAMHAAHGDREKAKALYGSWVQQAFERTAFFDDQRYRALVEALREAGTLERGRIVEILGPLPAVTPELEAQRRAMRESLAP